jgi:hypothetical protein
MTPFERYRQLQTRRSFLSYTTTGLGAMALGSLLHRDLFADQPTPPAGSVQVPHWNGVIHPLHFPQRAKRVIHLYMAGGPSHLETLDPKPRLAEMNGQPMPTSYTAGQPIAQLQGAQLRCFAPQLPFRRFGQSGQQIAAVFPHLGAVADDLCIIRSMRTEAINHDPAHTLMNTGTTISGRPSMGSWALYGLGAECDDLPGFVVLTSTGAFGQAQPIAQRQWSSGFLPSQFQGVQFRSPGEPVLYVSPPGGVSTQQQHEVVDAVNQLNLLHNQNVDDPEIVTRIQQYELAFRMQTSVPQVMDFANEPQHIKDLYGAQAANGTFAANCLLARRLAENGVRFIQVYHRDWDHHGGVRDSVAGIAREVDQPCAALITDLKQRGMLDETLVIWGGEFGRTPMSQSGSGRDHHIKGFSIWMAGGGIKGGLSYGNTDELGYNAEENIVHVHDLHATILYLMGIDHLQFTYRFQGRDFRLTDVSGEVVEDIIA